MKRRRKRKNKGINKKQAAVFGISLAVLLAAFAAVMWLGGFFGSSVEEEYIEPVSKETGVINVLVVGLDRSEGLTDTIMVARYDLDNEKVDILSIPRDTRMYIGSRYQKINSAYSVSKNGKKNGINGTIEAVNRLTGIPINYYIEFTCAAFRETIDALGGVDFDVPQNMNYDDPAQDLHIHLTKGMQHLDGDKAEQLVRFRRYPMGDIDRVAVQQSFLKAVTSQKINAEIITKIPELYKVLTKEIRTNFTLADAAKYARNVKDLSSENVTMYSVPGVANGTDYGSSYWIADMTQLGTLLEEHFGSDASKITIHSADGSSKTKDIKKTKTPAKSETKTTPKPSSSTPVPERPTHTAKPAAEEPKHTAQPSATEEPKHTEKPSETETPRQTEKPSEASPSNVSDDVTEE